MRAMKLTAGTSTWSLRRPVVPAARLSGMKCTTILGAILLPCLSGLHAQNAETDLPAFDVVSVKKSAPPFQERSGFVPVPGRFNAEKIPAGALIGYAYTGDFDELRGTPDWARNDYYNMTAPVPAGTAPAQVRLMVRRLLFERFRLATHIEHEERDALALVRVQPTTLPKGLEKIDVDCQALAATRQNNAAPFNPNEPMPPCRTMWNGREYRTGGATFPLFANTLRGMFDKQVVDQTGLEGTYRFTMRYSVVRPNWPEPSDDYPEITTALREQLGLKVVPTKINARILVVDRFEPPSPD